MATATLAAIQQKVRRITRSPSEAQLTTAQLNEYINTFILYDFPANLRLFSLRTNLTFYTQPGVDVYDTNTTVPTDPLFNFKNRYMTVHPPVFMAGVEAYYTQERDVFYGFYPQTNAIADTQLRGFGGTGPFTGTVFGRPMLQNNVIFTCLDTAGNAMALIDLPQVGNNTTGDLIVPDDATVIYGTINYITGAFSFSFPSNTMNGAIVYVENILYQPGKPLAMLFFDEEFTIRPVPDKLYSIQIEAYIRPTELINTTDIPELEQWWQYIAFGASKKIFEDRMDYDSLNMMMPSFKEQERLVLRTTLVQQANERTQTIYTQGKVFGYGGWWSATWPY